MANRIKINSTVCIFIVCFIITGSANKMVPKSDSSVRSGYEKWGDMLLPKNFLSFVKASVPNIQNLWPNGKIPFVIDRSLWRHRNLIMSGIAEYHSKTCLQFVPRRRERNYIRLTAGNGCFSHIGMVGGSQIVSLGHGCLYKGLVIHELGHAIGFFHEQNRHDRDNYIRVIWRNIARGMKSQFFKMSPRQYTSLGNFDMNSIMLYGERAFSWDGYRKTMVAKNGQRLAETYDKKALSSIDVKRINTIYNCSKYL